MYENTMREGDILSSFNAALKNHEFEVFYQPKVDILTGMLCGAEALVRWRKNGSYVPPYQFVPVLEEENLITELDFYVFEQVCADIMDWEAKGLRVVNISSNFSKLHLNNPDFAKKVLEVVCEGVETKEQVEFLAKADCRIVQGYYFDKPMPHDDFQKRLENPKYGDKAEGPETRAVTMSPRK